MLAFTRQLLELELVGMVDGEEIACTKKKEKDYLAWLRPRVEQFFLSLNKEIEAKVNDDLCFLYSLFKNYSECSCEAPSLFLILKVPLRKETFRINGI